MGLELLSIYNWWVWTRQQLDKLFLPVIARLSSSLSSSSPQQSGNDDDDAVARVMLGILGGIYRHHLIILTNHSDICLFVCDALHSGVARERLPG